MSKDTLELLRECDSGIKMAVGSIDEVSGHIKDEDLKNLLEKSKEEHSQLGGTIKEQLASLGDDGKDPGIMAKSMSWIKTNVKLGMNDSDRTVAGLMTDGCDMGIKSLTRYLNEYKGADGASRSTARRLIGIEEDLLCGLRRICDIFICRTAALFYKITPTAALRTKLLRWAVSAYPAT